MWHPRTVRDFVEKKYFIYHKTKLKILRPFPDERDIISRIIALISLPAFACTTKAKDKTPKSLGKGS